MRASRTPPAALAVLLALSVAGSARAYCRTTTCSPDNSKQPCSMAGNGCLVGGKPLYWSSACISFSVQKNGSPLRHISEQTADQVISQGFSQWVGAGCGAGGHPSIGVYDRGPVSCSKVEYNQHDPNANIFMFRDHRWPYGTGGSSGSTTGAETLALTTITYNVNTGEIYDADVEINSHDNVITVGDPGAQADLASIVTHESGHFLGLAHSLVPDATMYSSYTFGDTSLRSLAPDDVEGICAIYPPGRKTGACDPTPRHGYSAQCAPQPDNSDCRVASPGKPIPPWNAGALGGALVALGLLARRRRSGRSPA